MVKFDTLGTNFIPRIFEAKDWADLFGNFEDPMEELVKEFFSNARYIRVELKCWIRGKELSNTAFINLGRAQFLCDLITGAPIDIYAHIFQTIRKIAA